MPTKDGSNPTRWTMTGIFIQVKNRLKKQPIYIDIQKRFNFFTPAKSTAKKAAKINSRPYITIAMQLGIDDMAEGMQAQGQSNEGVTLRKRLGHPRYHINITGCSPEVYNVINTSSAEDYKTLLAYSDLVSEHPRTKEPFIDAVYNLKPYFKKDVSYSWASAPESRIGAGLTRGLPNEFEVKDKIYLGEYKEDEGGEYKEDEEEEYEEDEEGEYKEDEEDNQVAKIQKES
ncbi:hypothetical protein H0H87_012702 [Tephrocybe sp. NHM501043]|nr:hypothetical protein H0H87_012702 [Tephrocybe sp. NHM501043]